MTDEECKTCGRQDKGHWLGCAEAIATPRPSWPFDVTDHGLVPDYPAAAKVAYAIVTAVGTDQMSESYDALDDLIWDHYEPFRTMNDNEKALWREAVREAIEDGGPRIPEPTVPECIFGGCSEPRRSADKRVKFCETHSDPKNRK